MVISSPHRDITISVLNCAAPSQKSRQLGSAEGGFRHLVKNIMAEKGNISKVQRCEDKAELRMR